MPKAVTASLAIASVMLARTAMLFGGILIVLLSIATIAGFYLSAASSPLWLFVTIPLLSLLVIAIIALVLALAITNVLLPRKLSRNERKKIIAFNDELVGASEIAGMTRIGLLFILVKDAFQRVSIQQRIGMISGKAKSLEKDFQEICEMF